eukprot:g10692.t1
MTSASEVDSVIRQAESQRGVSGGQWVVKTFREPMIGRKVRIWTTTALGDLLPGGEIRRRGARMSVVVDIPTALIE